MWRLYVVSCCSSSSSSNLGGGRADRRVEVTTTVFDGLGAIRPEVEMDRSAAERTDVQWAIRTQPEPSSPIRSCWPSSLLVYVWHIFHPRLRFTNCMRAVRRLHCRSARRCCRMQSSMVIATGLQADGGEEGNGDEGRSGDEWMVGWWPKRRSPAFCRVSSGLRVVSCQANERMAVVQLVLFPSGSSVGCLNQSPVKNSRPRLTRTSVPIPRPPPDERTRRDSVCMPLLSSSCAVAESCRLSRRAADSAARRHHGPRHPRQNLV